MFEAFEIGAVLKRKRDMTSLKCFFQTNIPRISLKFSEFIKLMHNRYFKFQVAGGLTRLQTIRKNRVGQMLPPPASGARVHI